MPSVRVSSRFCPFCSPFGPNKEEIYWGTMIADAYYNTCTGMKWIGRTDQGCRNSVNTSY